MYLILIESKEVSFQKMFYKYKNHFIKFVKWLRFGLDI